jgi:hypothetical protein
MEEPSKMPAVDAAVQRLEMNTRSEERRSRFWIN